MVKDVPHPLHDTFRPEKASGVRYLLLHEGHIVILLLSSAILNRTIE
jgi:hypothetical protein